MFKDLSPDKCYKLDFLLLASISDIVAKTENKIHCQIPVLPRKIKYSIRLKRLSFIKNNTSYMENSLVIYDAKKQTLK